MVERIISIEDVMDVTPESLLFTDSSGVINKILFEECRKNWVDHVNHGDFVDWQGNSVQITFEESKCIGERNMTAKPPYILLYSDDKLMIEMKPDCKKLSKIQKEILAALYNAGGVTTFDMT